MLTLEDCIEICGLTHEEIRYFAEHAHSSELRAARERRSCRPRRRRRYFEFGFTESGRTLPSPRLALGNVRGV